MGLKKYVACHGSFLTASCLSCRKKRTAADIRVSFEPFLVARPYFCCCCGVFVLTIQKQAIFFVFCLPPFLFVCPARFLLRCFVSFVFLSW